MSMLLVMPWCRIDKPYNVGDINIVPFELNSSLNSLDEIAQSNVLKILSMYKTINGIPVDRAALVQYKEKSLTDELSESEIDITYELVTLACFCGLANNQYFNHPMGSYCNSDCFAFYVQKFSGTGSIAFSSRRRDGESLPGPLSMEKLSITVPVHVQPITRFSLDEDLLKAILEFRQEENSEWGRWQNAISCFNQANTDNDNVQHQMEWVLLSGALEHLLKAKSNAKDVAKKFNECMVPGESLLVRDATRKSNSWQDNGQALRYEWMKKFYGIRGDFAHGKMNTQQPSVWLPHEHLLLASLAFPLVVKCLLNKAGKYDLKNEDRAQIDSLERLANTDNFFAEPPEYKGSGDSHWRRLVDNRRSEIGISQGLRQYFDNCSMEDEFGGNDN